MNEEKMDEKIRELARDYHSPPPTPREEMWAAIQAAREEEDVFSISRRQRGWIAWGVGIAAVLMVGIGLGRLSVRPEQATAPVALTESIPAPVAGSPDGETAYRVVATQHLGRAELFLTSFRTEARAGEIDARVGIWAKDLLSTTRLLLDSPAGEDPELRVLLGDLELVLVQLSHLPTDETQEAKQEVEMVTDAIEEGGVLPKLRTALQGGTPPELNEEEL